MNEILNIGGDHLQIVLPCGSLALIDTADFRLVYKRNWYKTHYGYVKSGGGKEGLWLHRVVMNAVRGLDVDHINGVRTDNRKSVNLRLCSRSENLRNSARHKDSKSPYKGVTFRKDTQRWFARIMVHGKVHHLGQFDTAELAFEARKKAATELHGIFARSE